MLSPVFRDQLAFCPALVEMLDSGKTLSENGNELDIHSISTPNNLLIIKGLCSRINAKKTLEIGLGYGASCLLLAAWHQLSGQAPSGQHVGIDPLQDSLWQNATPTLLKKAGLSSYVRFLQRPSAFELPGLVTNGEKFDFIYVDGSHIFEDVFIDFYFSRLLLSPGGIIAFDDASVDHIAKVMSFITSNLQDSFEELDLSPLRPDGGRPLKYKIARALGKTQLRAFQLKKDPVRPQFSPLGKF